MSNYLRRTKNPVTGKFEYAEWLDDYYGKHNYGVRFPGRSELLSPFDARDYEWEFDHTPEALPSNNDLEVSERSLPDQLSKRGKQ